MYEIALRFAGSGDGVGREMRREVHDPSLEREQILTQIFAALGWPERSSQILQSASPDWLREITLFENGRETDRLTPASGTWPWQWRILGTSQEIGMRPAQGIRHPDDPDIDDDARFVVRVERFVLCTPETDAAEEEIEALSEIPTSDGGEIPSEERLDPWEMSASDDRDPWFTDLDDAKHAFLRHVTVFGHDADLVHIALYRELNGARDPQGGRQDTFPELSEKPWQVIATATPWRGIEVTGTVVTMDEVREALESGPSFD
jgi:hypothetical protein